jgi:prepilin peptidase CpaA
MEVQSVMTGTVLAILAIAAREDILQQRIPNTLNAAGLLLGVSLAVLAGGWNGLVDSAGGALVGTASFMPFYLRRGMGAGDVKLMAAAGAFLSPADALLAAALALVTGCIWATAIIVWRMAEPALRLEAPSAAGATRVWRAVAEVSITRKERFPYAVAIGAGVVVALWLNGSLAVLIAALGIA